MESWLIDTALFESLAPGGPQTDSFRQWIETHEDPVFLSAASIRRIQVRREIPLVRNPATAVNSLAKPS